MDLMLAGQTVLVLGPGDDLDRAIVRTLATEGASTLATVNGRHQEDLRQHSDQTRHWISQEDDINSAMAERLRRSLIGLGKEPNAVVVRADKPVREERCLWLPARARELARRRRVVVDTAIAASGRSPGVRLVFVHRVETRREDLSARRGLRLAMSAVVRQHRRFGTSGTVTVNSVLVGDEADLGNAAQLAGVLCFPHSATLTGALLPLGDREEVFSRDPEDEDD